MSSTPIVTVVKMMETLPVNRQAQVVDHLREYLADLADEAQWDEQCARTQPQLVAAACRARAEIQAGTAHSFSDWPTLEQTRNRSVRRRLALARRPSRQ